MPFASWTRAMQVIDERDTMKAENTVDVDELRELMADTLDVVPEALTDDARFLEDLEVDSLIALEMAVTLERRYQVRITEHEIKDIRRLADVRDLLDRKLAAA